jgi:hypothetical protein
MKKSKKSDRPRQFSTDCDEITRFMARHDIPYTRQNYLDVIFLGSVPDEIDPELEFSLPADLQLEPPEEF